MGLLNEVILGVEDLTTVGTLPFPTVSEIDLSVVRIGNGYRLRIQTGDLGWIASCPMSQPMLDALHATANDGHVRVEGEVADRDSKPTRTIIVRDGDYVYFLCDHFSTRLGAGGSTPDAVTFADELGAHDPDFYDTWFRVPIDNWRQAAAEGSSTVGAAAMLEDCDVIPAVG